LKPVRDAGAVPAVVFLPLTDSVNAGAVPFSTLEEAFGPTSLGIIVVQGLPERFTQLRSQLLQQASYLAHLPSSSLDAVTSAEAKYLVGWSHGKETLKPGVYDTLKGSYYVNCAFHADSSFSAAPVDPRFPNFPEYTAANVWPTESELPKFRATFEALCNLIIDVAVLVARSCDRYAEAHVERYEAGYLERMVKGSLTTKARLLHYFPPDPAATPTGTDDDEDSWCATHLDHGCLTGLTSALFIDESAGLPKAAVPLPQLKMLPKSPDPKAGLYIRSRTGTTTKVGFPADCLAFQTGEALERITRGRFRAVPHFVRGPEPGANHAADAVNGDANGVAIAPNKIARNTLAVFTQPNLGEVVDSATGMTFAEFAREIVGKNT
jgi:hypothetical protein